MPKKEKMNETAKTKNDDTIAPKKTPESEQEDRYTASERAADFKKYAQLKKHK